MEMRAGDGTHWSAATSAINAPASAPKLAAFADAPFEPPLSVGDAAFAPVLEPDLLGAAGAPDFVVPADALAEDPAPDDAEAEAGAAAATLVMADHFAAPFAESSPCLYGMKESAPVESSWTSAVMLAAYCAFASLVDGPAIVFVVFVSTLTT